MENEVLAKKLLDLYGTPSNIDIWLGAIAEPLVHGGRVGPLLTCLLGQQFQRIRDGDRQVKPLWGRRIHSLRQGFPKFFMRSDSIPHHRASLSQGCPLAVWGRASHSTV